MNDNIKSGKQILDEFFQEINEFQNIDENVVNVIIQLYEDDKLTDRNLNNALLKLREKSQKNEQD